MACWQDPRLSPLLIPERGVYEPLKKSTRGTWPKLKSRVIYSHLILPVREARGEKDSRGHGWPYVRARNFPKLHARSWNLFPGGPRVIPRPPTLKKKLDKKNQLKVTFSCPNLALKLSRKSWRKRSIDQQLKGSLAKVEVACAN